MNLNTNAPKLKLTRELPHPNRYAVALNGEFSRFAFDEVRAPLNKGNWRQGVFSSEIIVDETTPLDVEIGTGNGKHFQYRSRHSRDRLLVGIEVKYKPLIQSIRGVVKLGGKNAAICRYHAGQIDHLFATEEINNVFIHFPDPWTSPRKPSHRILQVEFLQTLYRLQRPGSFVEFKTDSLEAFQWSLQQIEKSAYNICELSYDLHQSHLSANNFITGFESIFLRQNLKINYVKLTRPT